MKRTPYDVTRTLAWQIADTLLLRQIVDDLIMLTEFGIGDFEAIVRDAIGEASKAKLHAQEWGSDLFFHPVAALATRLGFDERTVVGYLAWQRYRTPIVELASLVRAEVERLRIANRRAGVA